ncbi:MAG: sigma-70 family RNA polymerase sigma factor [Alistipes sp.]|jgi:RNA polymerase sigma factor (sigma-70 family)|nr:sigma-70 family RNA polymerase sigma factor [Alistipes sp.]
MSEAEHKDDWSRFIAGDNDAYCRIYHANVGELYRYGVRFTSDGELVKDCIQELFTTIYRNRRRLSVRGDGRAYLFVSLRHNLVRVLHRRHIFREDFFGEGLPEALPFSQDEHTPEESFEVDEMREVGRRQLEEMLATLTPRQREIIRLRYVNELSINDICEQMSLNYQSAQNLIQRSLKKIRKKFASE